MIPLGGIYMRLLDASEVRKEMIYSSSANHGNVIGTENRISLLPYLGNLEEFEEIDTSP